jgi:hypothetical protein
MHLSVEKFANFSNRIRGWTAFIGQKTGFNKVKKCAEIFRD